MLSVKMVILIINSYCYTISTVKHHASTSTTVGGNPLGCWDSLRRKLGYQYCRAGEIVFLTFLERSMLHVVLYQPEIPPNTGNIIRLCANSGTSLHLVGPLGFVLDDARLRRAGLDYDELTNVQEYLNWDVFRKENPALRLWAFSTHGKKSHCEVATTSGDGLLFGPESRGLPSEVLEEIGMDCTVRIPMQQSSRSLNLSNAVAIGVYESLRQLGFPGLG